MRIGRIIPWLLALGAVLDAGTRLLPLDVFAFRAWEVMAAASAPTGPFAASKVYVNPMSYGDLASAPEQAHLRDYRFEYFSTDAWGFRNRSALSSARPGEVGWILIGDSFAVGSGVSDRDTLARQLEGRLGTRMYNAAAAFPLRLSDLEFTAERVGMRGGVVLLAITERVPPPPAQQGALPRALSDGPPASPTWLEQAKTWRQTADVSRLGILAGWAYRRIVKDAPTTGVLPFSVQARRLTSGDEMLFLNDDVDFSCDPSRRFGDDYVVWLRDQLAARHRDLVVLLVPNKYTVYGPLVADPAARRPRTAALTTLEAALRARDVFVVNATRPMQQAAAAQMARHEYLYFMDDTHWNARGIAVAADALVDAYRHRDQARGTATP